MNRKKQGNYRCLKQGLPKPGDYYQAQFSHLKIVGTAWVSIRCCFHEDKHPSLRINLDFGGFRCFGCGVHGGTIIAFHALRYNLSFKTALSALEGWL